jgi:predicted secreted acid phosphatase
MKFVHNILIAIFFALAVTLTAKPPLLPRAIKQIATYYDTQYENDLKPIINKIKQCLLTIKSPEEKTVIFDVDFTLLNDYIPTRDMMHKGEFCSWSIRKKTIQSNEEMIPAVSSMKELFDWVKQHKFKIILLTDRKELLRAETEQNLRQEGFCGYEKLVMRSPELYSVKTPDITKNKAREALAQAGHIIVANIGDQKTDFMGYHNGKCFKLPNYIDESRSSGTLPECG